MKAFVSIFLALGLLACTKASEPATATESHEVIQDTTGLATFSILMEEARLQEVHTKSLGEIMVWAGKQQLGLPYAAGTLDRGEEETLVIKLDGYDCVTFVETMLAAARTIKAETYQYKEFRAHMADQRYRDGMINGYCSRLHYFTDWILENERRGNVDHITEDLGGEVLDKTLNFMSTHRESYPRFATNDSMFAEVVLMEERLAGHSFFYLPQDRIRTVYPQLQPGDILAFVTDIKGLDVTHTGMVYEEAPGQMGVLHASTNDGVTLSPDLQAYVQNNRRQIGIVVARPLE